ncbi:MAG: hypothetical protein RSE23_01815 [Clostridia bacterium]
MGVNAAIKHALTPLPWPSMQHPAQGNTAIYLTWQAINTRPEGWASNESHRMSHMVQVNVFSCSQLLDADLDTVLNALRAGGVTVQYAGPHNYEPDTKLHHIPITCRWQE